MPSFFIKISKKKEKKIHAKEIKEQKITAKNTHQQKAS